MNRPLTFTFAAAFCAILTGCPGGGSVRTDYDHSTNFSQFHSFSFGSVHTDNPLYEQRVRDEVTRDLQGKGLQLASGTGDLVVTAVGAVHNRQEYQTFYDNPGFGYYWGGFGSGFGTSTTTVQHYKVGTLVIDLYNGQNKHLVWRGVARRGASGDAGANTAHLNSAIDRMFERYPPS